MNAWWKRAVVVGLAGLLLVGSGVVPPAGVADAQSCRWSGRWETGVYGVLEMSQVRHLVIGAYSYSGHRGLMVGSLGDSSLNLRGEWAEDPAAAGQGAGLFEFEMSPDCNSFRGLYSYGDSLQAAGEWNARRIR